MGETWDPDLIKEVARVEATEARWVFHAKERGGIIVRAPNAVAQIAALGTTMAVLSMLADLSAALSKASSPCKPSDFE